MNQSIMDRRNREIVEIVEKTGVRHRFQNELDDNGQNEVGEDDDRQHRQSKKTDQQAGLLPRVRFPVKKVHGLLPACSTSPVGGKSFCERAKRITSPQPPGSYRQNFIFSRTSRRSGWLPPAFPSSRCRTRVPARARCKPPCAGRAIARGGRAGRDCCPR